MSTNDSQDNIRVINEEYERVLSNPENIIMSDDLQGLIDLPMGETTHSTSQAPSVDTLIITALDNDGLGVSVRGRLSELSHSGPSAYTITIETENARREFMTAIERYAHAVKTDTTTPLILGGAYEIEIEHAQVEAWSLMQTEHNTFKIKIEFRSNNVIL